MSLIMRQSRIRELQKEIVDEMNAEQEYRAMAKNLMVLGYAAQATVVAGIAEDEKRHRDLLRAVLSDVGARK